MESSIKSLAVKFENEIIAIRRHLHQHPELSFEEGETSKYILSRLQEFGIPCKSGYVKTGITGIIKGKNPEKKVIALRADMDALPVTEQNSLAFKSKNTGIMHACGHDVHTASLLGCAKILQELKEHFEGTVLLIFQPAEEKIPGGARLMIEEGALSDPVPQIIIGQHVMPTLPTGTVGFKEGIYMASSDEVYINVSGKGGHAAMPDQITDTVLIASQIIVALQQIASRFAPPAIPTVLSFGKLIADGSFNVIPDSVKIEGTFRTMDEEWRNEAHSKIRKISCSIAESLNGHCEVEIRKGYPVLTNDQKITAHAKKAAIEFLGRSNVVDLEMRMTAEDFAYYSDVCPGTFYRLGTTATVDKTTAPLHSGSFIVDEDSIKTGMGLMAYLAITFLSE